MENIKLETSHKLPTLLPQLSGVYLFKNRRGKVIYVGKAKNLRNRLISYFQKDPTPKTKNILKLARTLSFVLVPDEIDALILEANLIKKYQPKFNVELKDGKFYPYIKITIKDNIPKILVVRHILDDQSLYFGPYTDVSGMYFLLKTIRKIFPYCIHKNPYPSCLYIHLGLCPFPGKLITCETYRQNLNYIIAILKGQRSHVRRVLEKELKIFVDQEGFEEAAILQKQIENLNFHYHQSSRPEILDESYELNNLRQKEQADLISALKKHAVSISKLNRIECYDISHTMGKNSTASMVVLLNGNPANSFYKRFRIKKVAGINDFAAMQEVLQRRITHSEWEMPDLIVVDGGKSQLSACVSVLQKAHLKINALALAKRLETIYLPNGTSFTLSAHNLGLQLLQRARDEAHRFAKKYHRLLRSKALFS